MNAATATSTLPTESALSLPTDLIDRGDDALTAWAIDWLGLDLADLWPALDDDGRDALRETADDDETYDDDDDAETALAARVEADHGADLPDDFVLDHAPDGLGLIVTPITDTDHRDPYLLDRADLTTVIRDGWAGVLYAAGLVVAPGVYSLPSGERTYDAGDDGPAVTLSQHDWQGFSAPDSTVLRDAMRSSDIRAMIAAARTARDYTADLVLADAIQEVGTAVCESVAETIRTAVRIAQGL